MWVGGMGVNREDLTKEVTKWSPKGQARRGSRRRELRALEPRRWLSQSTECSGNGE
jgi:hypothetical protein